MLDLSEFFTICSPSVSFGVEGVSFGPLEISDSSKRSAKPRFVCRECSSIVTDNAAIEISCDVCQKFHPLKEVSVARGYGTLCNKCVEVLKGQSEATHDLQRYTLRFIKLTSDTVIVPLTDILTMPINSL